MTDKRQYAGARGHFYMDPLDIEIEPGFKVRDIKSVEECVGVISRLELQISSITSQIARDEQNPSQSRPGWRSSAQNAIRWKKRAMKAIRLHQEGMARTAAADKETKRATILKVIGEEIGENAMLEYVRIAHRRYPSVFGEDAHDENNASSRPGSSGFF